MTLQEELRCRVNALVSMIKFSQHLNAACEEMECFFAIANYEQKIFEKEENKQKFETVRKNFENSVESIKIVYGNDIVDDCFNVFLKVIQDEAECKKIFGVKKLPEGVTDEHIFRTAFNKIKGDADIFNGNFDDYEYWVNVIREILNPLTVIDKNDERYICPYCGNITEKFPSSYFLGAANKSVKSFVWGCTHCGAYAFADNNGDMIGTVADSELHKKRFALKKMISEMCDLCGLTYYESFALFSNVIGVKIEKIGDVELLDVEQCNKGMSYFLKYKNIKSSENIVYPKNHKQLMEMLKNGGRLKILTSLVNDDAGKLLIPIAVGDTAFIIRNEFSTENITLPKVLDYEFKGPVFTIIHPDKKERFRMYPPDKETAKWKQSQ